MAFKVEIRDIEQLVSLGEDLHACPYYGTRQAIPAAKVSTGTISPLVLLLIMVLINSFIAVATKYGCLTSIKLFP